METIKKHPVRHSLLKNYIRFFWTINMTDAHLNHTLIPQRNINLRLNLNDTPWFLNTDAENKKLENAFFTGLQDHNQNFRMKVDGPTDVLGICFMSDGFYPFFGVLVSEFRNNVYGADEAGFTELCRIGERLREIPDLDTRISVVENSLVALLLSGNHENKLFRKIFIALKQCDAPTKIEEFCIQENIGLRQLQRLYNKHVGLSASTYGTLNRFHNSLNELLRNNFNKLSDLAYDNGYYDQMHFVRDFKRFSGNTPKDFIRNNNSILQVGKLS